MSRSLSALNWFPGHMRRARRQIIDALHTVDFVIEVLDARAPWSSENPLLAGLRERTPSLKILNKVDLADPIVTEQWISHLEETPGVRAFPVRKDRARRHASDLLRTGLSLVTGDTRNVRAMIVGVPNVGKSTLINALAGQRKARTGNAPNVTRGQQLIRVGDNLTLLDTPGFLWPRLEPVECGYRLAVTGAISDRVVEFENIALFGATFMLERYPSLLKLRYGDEVRAASFEDGAAEVIEGIGRARGCFKRGGEVDTHKASALFVRELRHGKVGRVTFELPSDAESKTETLTFRRKRRR